MPEVTQQVSGQAEIQTQKFWPPDWESMSNGFSFARMVQMTFFPRTRKRDEAGSLVGASWD